MSGRYRPALLSSAGAGIGPDHKQLIAGGQASGALGSIASPEWPVSARSGPPSHGALLAFREFQSTPLNGPDERVYFARQILLRGWKQTTNIKMTKSCVSIRINGEMRRETKGYAGRRCGARLCNRCANSGCKSAANAANGFRAGSTVGCHGAGVGLFFTCKNRWNRRAAQRPWRGSARPAHHNKPVDPRFKPGDNEREVENKEEAGQSTFSNSTSNISVGFAGMTPPAPRAP